jgi:prepilin-type N-terminal cleavage/methylation domain-containing protein
MNVEDPRSQHRDSRHGEAGLTLIELICAVVIMGIAFVAILAAMGTSIIVSDVHAKRARAETIAQSWAEQLVNATYQPCATTSTAQYLVGGSGVTVDKPTGYTTSIDSVQYWNPSTALPAQFVNSCSTDPGLQKITLRVTPPGGRGVQTLTFLKRNPS